MALYGPEEFKDIINFRGGHLRVLGPPGSGKTSLLLDRYRSLAGAGAGATVVTYTRRAHALLTAELLGKNTARSGQPPAYTYHQLALEVLSSSPSGERRVLGEMEERVVLSRILRGSEILSSEYQTVAESESFQRSVLAVFRILMQHPLSGADLDALAANAAGRRARDVFVLFRAYRNYLDRHGLITYYDLSWRAADALIENPGANPLRGVDVLMIDDFHDVDAGQYRLIEALAPPEGAVEVNVFGDPCGARFRDRGTSDLYLREYFSAAYSPRDFLLPVVCPSEAALGPTIRDLMSETIEGGEWKEAPAGNIEVALEITEDEAAEAQAVAEEAAGLILSGGYGPDDIAVAARDVGKYELVLSRAFAERGLRLDGGRRETHAAESFARALLVLLDNPGDEPALAVVANSPFYPEFEELFAVETGGETGAALGGDGTAAARKIIRSLYDEAVTKKSGVDLSSVLRTRVAPLVRGRASGSAGEKMLSFFGTLLEEWDRYTRLVEHLKVKSSFAEFAAASAAVTSRSTDAPATRGGVGLFSCRELSSERYPVVFVVGCSEFLFPRPPVRESFIPFGLLQECVDGTLSGMRPEFFETRTAEAHLRDEYALLLDTLTRAGRKLYLSAPQKHGGQYCPAPAFILSGIPREEPDAVTGRSPSAAIRLAAAGASYWNGKDKREARPFKIPERPLSPTSLLAYTVCPRKYFYSKVLKIEEEKSVNLIFGSLFHAMAEKICAEHGTYEEMSSFVRSKKIDGLIDELITENLSGESALTVAAARIHLKEMALGLLELDGARVDGFRVIATEQFVEFGHGGKRFVGVIDRVDRSGPGGTAALDYKTGSGPVPKTGTTVRGRILPGNKKPEQRLWQVPFYCRALADTRGDYPRMFSYYVIEANKDRFAAGVLIGGEEEVAGREPVFEKKEQSKLGFVTEDEIKTCMDEAAGVAGEMFGERTEFPRTDDEQRCRTCSYRYVCERDV